MSIVLGQTVEADDFVGNPAAYLSFETTTGTTHSLTTVANQKVIVWAKGNLTLGGGGGSNLELKYNGVQKDIVTAATADGATHPFSLMYTEIPGAGTQNLTVTSTSGTPANVVIIVCKLLVG